MSDAVNDPAKLEEVRAFYANDTFATVALGAEIVEVADGSSTVRFTVTDLQRNAVGTPMGGALYTLADFACTTALYRTGQPCVTVEGGLQFLSAARGDVITAHATADKMGRTLQYCRVELTDSTGLLIATGSYTFFRTSSSNA